MWIIIAAGDLQSQTIGIPVLIGMLVTSCLPTTIASNVVMTRNAGGDDAAAIIEVVIGNVFGSFLCPGLIYALIPRLPEFSDWMPASPDTLGQMYKDVSIKLGLTVIAPLVVGQTTRVFFEKWVVWCVANLHLGKVSTLFLCTLIWYVLTFIVGGHLLTRFLSVQIFAGPHSPTLSKAVLSAACPDPLYSSPSS